MVTDTLRLLSRKFISAAGVALCLLGPSGVHAGNDVPQIMLTADILQRIKDRRAQHPRVEADYQALISKADSTLGKPTYIEEFEKTHQGDSIALVGYAQKLGERLTTLGMAWRMTGDTRYADRGKKELLQFAKLDTWYPAHFLGLSRIALAVALGYSWMSDTWDDDEHGIIQAALVEKALNEGTRIYELDKFYFDHGWVVPQLWVHPTPIPKTLPDGTAISDITWPVASFNWNIVCNAGMIVAALAVSNAEPDLAKSVMDRAQVSLRNGFAKFAPDGAWSEGPMYGTLSARDAAVLIDSLESVLGHDFDLAKSAGLPGFGDYLIHSTGPTGMLFNYGDSDTKTDVVPMPWLSERFGRPDYGWHKSGSDPSSHPAFDLIWRQKHSVPPVLREPTSLWFGGLGLVAMRSAWNDPDATYVGFKAGPLRSHHNNLDAGTFVLDARGVRWAIELGRGNYQLPGYFTDSRFDYYRTSTIGQNTLTFDSANQHTDGRAQIEDFGQFPGFDFAIADLSDPYEASPGTVRRGIGLIGGDTVLIQDEIAPAAPGPLSWTMHTEAKVTLNGSQATLQQDGEEMTAIILSPPGALFALKTANPCDTPFNADCAEQKPNTGIQRLTVDLAQAGTDDARRITVALSGSASRIKTLVPQVTPLNEWRLNATLSQESKK